MLYYSAMLEVNSLYLHFPFCNHLCNYCDFYKHKLIDQSQILQFERLLEESWDVHEDLLIKQNAFLGKLHTLYLGGGTPSLWGEAGARFFKESFIDKKIKLENNCEFTMEVDPGTWSDKAIQAWQKNNVNRFSLGIQACDDQQLEILDRKHRVKDVIQTLSYFKKSNVNFSIDFIIGLPNNAGSKRNIKAELLRMMEYNPNHFSVYILQTRKNYPHLDKVPDDNVQSEQYLEVVELLEENDFLQYEISNFAKKGKESKHNFKYWNYQSVAAIGANATGLIVQGEEALRYQWKSLSAGYQLETLKRESLLIEKAYLALRTNQGLPMSFFESICKPDVRQQKRIKLLELMKLWSQRGYLKGAIPSYEECSEYKIKLTPVGYLVLDSIMDDLFSASLL